MKLADYIHLVKSDIKTVALELNVSDEAVRNWIKGERTPSRDYMTAIYEWSMGHVAPNDFFTLPDLRQGGDYRSSLHLRMTNGAAHCDDLPQIPMFAEVSS